MYRILVVEDDDIICKEMMKNLIKWDYEVEAVTDFHEVMALFVRFEPQLVLMDISLPFYNGFYWCTEMRRVSQVPIVFVSSAGDKMNAVMAMNMGADDFITKPFDLDVLAAKVQALIRRTYSFGQTAPLLEHKGVIINFADSSMQVNGEKVDLTKNEFRIMQQLFENRGKIVTREEMMKHLWDSECFVDDNTLSVNVTRIRKKLEEVGAVEFIVTKKGIGYMLG